MVIYENNVKNATSLKTQVEIWYLAMPILGFSGSKYNINLMQNFPHKSLEDCGEEVKSYLAPNDSYDSFIKAYKCKIGKYFSPMIILIILIRLVKLNYHLMIYFIVK